MPHDTTPQPPADQNTNFSKVVSFLWAIADLLNGAFKKSEFQKIILPFTVLRRLDYALEATKDHVLETERKLKEKGLENRHAQLCRASGYAFYNTSKFTYESLLRDDANLARNLRQCIHVRNPVVKKSRKPLWLCAFLAPQSLLVFFSAVSWSAFGRL